jgi:hypothetical protein
MYPQTNASLKNCNVARCRVIRLDRVLWHVGNYPARTNLTCYLIPLLERFCYENPCISKETQ